MAEAAVHDAHPIHPKLGSPATVYYYRRASGDVAFAVCRFEPKDFRPCQRRNGQWVWNLDGVPVLPYRLPELEQALFTGSEIWIVDGEKDADALAAEGVAATCCARSQGWSIALAEQLTGASRIRIVADRDENGVGLKQAIEVRDALLDAGAIASSDMEIVQAAEGKDAYDHIAAGRTLHEFAIVDDSEPTEKHEAGSFSERVTSHVVNLIALIREGIPPVEYLPASEHMLRRGKRHHWAAPKKVGKSFSGQIHALDIVLAGGRVVIFDRENGGDLYASRLEDIIQSRKLDEAAQAAIEQRLVYYEFPRFKADDGADLAALCLDADLVIFDSQRMYLSDLGLEENSSDDYAKFMAQLIEPLFQAGIATLILDNTGLSDPKRGRGTGSKSDLNEILFSLETIERFHLDAVGKVRLEITDSRFGNAGRWEMELGGGKFGSWQRVDHAAELVAGAFRFTGKMERCSIFVENCVDPPGRNTIVDAVGGNARATRSAIDTLVREGYFRSLDGIRGAKRVESLRPYREATDPLRYDALEGNARDTFAHDHVPDHVPENPLDHVPDHVPQEPHNQEGLLTASDHVRPRPDGETYYRVPGGGFPYGEPPTASGESGETKTEQFQSPPEDDGIPF